VFYWENRLVWLINFFNRPQTRLKLLKKHFYQFVKDCLESNEQGKLGRYHTKSRVLENYTACEPPFGREAKLVEHKLPCKGYLPDRQTRNTY